MYIQRYSYMCMSLSLYIYYIYIYVCVCVYVCVCGVCVCVFTYMICEKEIFCILSFWSECSTLFYVALCVFIQPQLIAYKLNYLTFIL